MNRSSTNPINNLPFLKENENDSLCNNTVNEAKIKISKIGDRLENANLRTQSIGGDLEGLTDILGIDVDFETPWSRFLESMINKEKENIK